MPIDNIIFLSHILDAKTPCYGGRSKITIESVRQIKEGDTCNEMHWSLGNHSGTHMDAPRHFIVDGHTVDSLPAKGYHFDKVQLIDIPRVRPGQILGKDLFPKLLSSTEFVLIRTGFEKKRNKEVYWKDSPGLHFDLALYLKEHCPRIRAVGVDFISISNMNNRDIGRRAHREFLGRKILLIEDMKLSGLKKSPKKVLVAPLRTRGADGAPCTIFAWR